MSACQENDIAEQIRNLKEGSRFLGAIFQDAVLKGNTWHVSDFLKQISDIEREIKVLERRA